MGLLDFPKGKPLSDRLLADIAGRCCGAVMCCYSFFHEKGLLRDDKTRLEILFNILGMVLLYTDYQLFLARGPEVRSYGMDRLISLVGTVLGDKMPNDPQYRLTALLEPYINLWNGARIETSAYLMGMVQEVFKKYGAQLRNHNGLEIVTRDFSRDLCA